MNLINLFTNLFKYSPKSEYEFSLLGDQTVSNSSYSNENDTSNKSKDIYPSLNVNLELMKIKYNILINSDIILREFTLNARGKQYNAFIIYIDGMVDSKLINDFILNPLMLRSRNNTFDGSQNKIISEAVTNNITVRKIKKFNLVDYIYSNLIPQNSVTKNTTFDEALDGINSGNCVLFVDTINTAFNIDVKGFKQRNVDSPNNELVIKGPQEAFVENLRTNTSLIRKIINNENLIIENVEVGNITKTKCGICYMQDIANNDLIAEVKYRLNNLSIDSLLSSGQLEQLIEDSSSFGIPQILSTERPDKCTKYLMQGRVVVLVNGNPYALIMPATLIDFISSPEDTNLRTLSANFLKLVRIIAAFLTLLLPGTYIAVTSFHQEILPTELLFSILAARENVPFPVIFELLLMEISFELIREAGLRVPSPIGPTIGIVGALILGEAAVNAGIVSPILIIIVAITGISSFAIPDFSFGFHLRIFRFLFILLGAICGFLGIGLGLFVYICLLANIKSFGVPYTVPFAPATQSEGNGYFIPPIWKQEYRANFLSPKKRKAQDKISMNWKFGGKNG